MKKIFKYIILTIMSIPIIFVILYYFLIFIYIQWHGSKDDQILKMDKFDKSSWLASIQENEE